MPLVQFEKSCFEALREVGEAHNPLGLMLGPLDSVKLVIRLLA